MRRWEHIQSSVFFTVFLFTVFVFSVSFSFHCLCLFTVFIFDYVNEERRKCSPEQDGAHVRWWEHIQSSVWKKPIVWIRVTNSLELENVFNPSIKSRLRPPTIYTSWLSSLSTGIQSKDFPTKKKSKDFPTKKKSKDFPTKKNQKISQPKKIKRFPNPNQIKPTRC